MKNKAIIFALTTLLSIGISSASFADDAKTTNKASCKKQASSMKFKDKKEKSAFIKECKKSNKKEKAGAKPEAKK